MLSRFILVIVLLVSCSGEAVYAGRCSGGLCNVCTNCSKCAYCSSGGTCSVCAGGRSSQKPTSPASCPFYASPVAPTHSHAPSSSHTRPDTYTPSAPRPYPTVKPLAKPLKPGDYVEMSFDGKCVAVHSGDAISVMHHGRAEKVALQGIDAPEANQPFGKTAKQLAVQKALGATLTVFVNGKNQDGSTLGYVRLADGTVLNEYLVQMGHAWWDRKKAPQNTDLQKLEAAAKKAGRGLWADCCAVAPWEWRRGVRASATKPTVTKKPATAPTNKPAHLAQSPSSQNNAPTELQDTINHRPSWLNTALASLGIACAIFGIGLLGYWVKAMRS